MDLDLMTSGRAVSQGGVFFFLCVDVIDGKDRSRFLCTPTVFLMAFQWGSYQADILKIL